MLFAALRDMQWRKRRLFIAVLSTGLIFGMTLVLTGLANGFRVEAQHTVDSMGVDQFVVKTGAAGPFLGSTRSPTLIWPAWPPSPVSRPRHPWGVSGRS
ncbi:macB-like periplasmic core domain protein [Mycobacterium kansasii]|uniref:MacB-like periplasmic core domain protein n=1 Tax=Mycobacterium kansasii TaxID=1768 RepID=A0A1V3XC75_MYCKA|nr:macB-like periplasmic core domain protein [Mycobacterium kansasii]